MRFLIILILSIPLYSQSSKVLCELNGEYSVTYKDIKKTYLAEGIELFRNLARQTQQSLFLLRRAKTNFAEEDWEKNSLYVVQYWDVDSAEETYKSLTHTLELLQHGLTKTQNGMSKQKILELLLLIPWKLKRSIHCFQNTK